MNIERDNLFIGLFVVGLGLFFLADNLDWIPENIGIGDLWPVFLILFGVWLIFSKHEKP